MKALVSENRTIYTLRELKRLKKLFYVERDFIKIGYRAHENMTAGMCLRSLCQMHNETSSILTHALPAIYMIVQTIMLLMGTGCYAEFKTSQSVWV